MPPAWLARTRATARPARAGLGFSEDDRAIRLFPSGRRVPLAGGPVERADAVRAWGSVAVARARWTLQRGARYPRIAFHPQDLDHPATAAALGPDPRSLARAALARITYYARSPA